MRKYLYSILIGLFLLAILPPVRVLAAGRDGFRLDDGGTVTVVSQHAAKEEISSLGFSLLVETENADKVEFQFAESSAEILEFRYDGNTKELNIYVAGTEALFAEGTDALTIGRVIVRDENGGDASAKVSVVGDSLQYVYGSELKTMQELDLPEAVQLGSARGDSPGDSSNNSPGGSSDNSPGGSSNNSPGGSSDNSPGNSSNDPSDDGGDDNDDDGAPVSPVTTPAPTVLPVRTPRPTTRPVATTAPTRVPGAGNSFQASAGTPRPSPGSSPENTPTPAAGGEKVPGITPLPGGGNAGQTADESRGSQGVDIVLVIAIAAIVISAIVVGAAFLVLRNQSKKPRE